jgi:hypothetical protein
LKLLYSEVKSIKKPLLLLEIPLLLWSTPSRLIAAFGVAFIQAPNNFIVLGVKGWI